MKTERPDMAYHYEIDQCDVAGKTLLQTYRDKRSEWLFLFAHDPDHAIWKQISTMLWNDAVFRTANEARRLSRLGGYQSSARNWSIARFMDHGFVAVQTLSVRKLMEKAANDPARQVVSLRRVLDDVRRHRHLITRENYIAHDGLPYDPEPGRQAYYKKAISESRAGVHMEWLSTAGPDAWATAEMMHERFDRLCDVERSDRSRTDLVSEAVFDRIETILREAGCNDIVKYGNKFVAHAADEHSRATLLDGRFGISLDSIARCHEGICRAAIALYGPILYEGSGGLFPIPQFDHFENLEAPFLSPDHVDELSAFWQANVERIESWTEGDPISEAP
jgi:hypothetical protein